MANTIVDSIQRIPPVTRFFTIASVIACILIAVNVNDLFEGLFCSYSSLLNDFSRIQYAIKNETYTKIALAIIFVVIRFYKFATLLLIPSALLSDSRYNALIDIYFFYTFSNHLEIYGGKFNGNFPDYLWYAFICGTLVNVFSLLYNALIDNMTIFQYDCLLACVTYTWARCNKNARINLMGIVPIKAYYLPLGNILIKLIIRGPDGLVDTIIGILAGYFYLCMQLNTLPVYNLLSGAYGQNTNRSRNNDARKVGILTYVDTPNRSGGSQAEFIEDSIYDKGYLKAPKKLYDLLGYPINTSERTTAFTTTRRDSGIQGRKPSFQSQQRGVGASTLIKSENSATGNSTGYSWLSGNNNAFRGKGHRLGG